MTMSPKVSAAREELEAEYAQLVEKIAQLRKEHDADYAVPMPVFEKLQAIYKKRDQLANVCNNLKAYYDAD